MELEELITIWKKQGPPVSQPLQAAAFEHLLRCQSAGVLSKIRRHLQGELLVIGLLIVAFNGLFLLVELPLTLWRWMAFSAFNLITFHYGYCYWQLIHRLRSEPSLPLRVTLSQIIGALRQFGRQSHSFNLPVGVIGILMFSISQQLLSILPWLVGEFFLWKWVLAPRMQTRFDWYVGELEYHLKNLDA